MGTVGFMLGHLLGLAVGIAVGTSVGEACVGVAVGNAVGYFVGASVGLVGENDGVAVGTLDGICGQLACSHESCVVYVPIPL